MNTTKPSTKTKPKSKSKNPSKRYKILVTRITEGDKTHVLGDESGLEGWDVDTVKHWVKSGTLEEVSNG